MKRLGKLVIGLFLGGFLSSAFAQTFQLPEISAVPAEHLHTELQRTPGLTPADLGDWLDGYMTHALEASDIAGAVIVIVKDGEVLLKRGYGYADVDSATPVNPENTMFRPGSVSKLITWTAVMQLKEKGLIDLDRDINDYIDFEITPYSNTPITMRHVMTHTAGFEERFQNLITSEVQYEDLATALKEWVPSRVFEPGTTPAYSNYATALAGYVVEQVSQMSFDEYVEKHIFLPLGMENSTFRQPLPERFQEQMSSGYTLGSEPAEDFEIVSLPPAGSLSATGTDMARFMIAHLQNGRFGDQRILEGKTAQEMHNSHTALMAPLNGMRLGFYDQNINGRRVIAHGGDTQLFHSLLTLFIDDGVGVFMSVNSSGVPGRSFRTPFFEQFADRYFPAEDQKPVYLEESIAKQHLAMVAGDYVSVRGAFSSYLALGGLIGQVKIIPNADGTISLPLLIKSSGIPRRYREVEPFLWHEVNGHDRIAAIVEDGQVVRVSSDLLSGIMVFDRAPFWWSSSLFVPLILVAVGCVLLTAIQWPLAAITRRHFQQKLLLTGSRALSYRAVRVACIIALLAVMSWILLLLKQSGVDGMAALGQAQTHIVVASLLTCIGVMGGLFFALYYAITVWSDESGWFAKLWCIVLFGSFSVLCHVSVFGKLISFSTQF